jgi:chorismate mutase
MRKSSPRTGRTLELAPTLPVDADRARLADLVARRADLVTMIGAKRNRAGTTHCRWIAREIAVLERVLQDRLATAAAQIATLIETRKALAAQSCQLCSVPGIGSALSAVLIVCLGPVLTVHYPR